jgi:hypothetical protein
VAAPGPVHRVEIDTSRSSKEDGDDVCEMPWMVIFSTQPHRFDSKASIIKTSGAADPRERKPGLLVLHRRGVKHPMILVDHVEHWDSPS